MDINIRLLFLILNDIKEIVFQKNFNNLTYRSTLFCYTIHRYHDRKQNFLDHDCSLSMYIQNYNDERIAPWIIPGLFRHANRMGIYVAIRFTNSIVFRLIFQCG